MSEPKKAFNKKRLILIGGMLAALLATGGTWWWVSASSKVSTDDARVKGNLVNISAKAPGQVVEVLAKEGDAVEAGQVIARIDDKAPAIQVEQARANLASAQVKLASLQAGSRPQQVAQSEAGVAQAAANLSNARKNYERAASLYEEGATSAQQRDAAQTAMQVAEAQYRGANESYSLTAEGASAQDVQFAQAQVAQAEAAFKAAQLQLDNCTVVSPTAGLVAQKSVDQGEIVAGGQPLFTITNPDDSWVEANIEETSIGRIQTGQSVDVSIDAYSGRKIKGTVIEVGAATGSQFALLPMENTSGNFTKVTQRLPVKIRVTDAAGAVLKPGMSAVIAIHVK